MASFFLAPDPIQGTFFIPGGNTPGNGAQLFIYVANSVSTKTTVYKDDAGGTAWSNPIVLDSGGNLPNGGVVWIPAGVAIKAVWAPSNDTDPPASPYRTIDDITGVNDATASQTDWITGPTPTFISSTQFTLVGDQTATFVKGRRLRFTVTAGTVYGTITSVAFAAVTTVNVVFASGALDSGLSAVYYSLIAPDNPSINADYVNKQASSVASAGNGTTNIWGVAGDSLHVTGTNAIFGFSTAPYAGAKRELIFDAALSLNSSAANRMPGNLNVTTAANDKAWVYADTTTSTIISFYKASGRPVLVAAGDFAAQVSNTVLIGPSTGANAVPTFRKLVVGDLPTTPGLVLLSATTAANSPVIDFTGFSSTYDTYLLQLVGVTPVAAALMVLRMSNDGGATFKAGASDYVYFNSAFDQNGGNDSTASAGASFINLAGLNGTNNVSTNGGMNSAITLYNLNSTSQRKFITSIGAHPTGNGFTPFNGGGTATTAALITSAVNAIRILPNSNSTATGSFYLYGLSKTP